MNDDTIKRFDAIKELRREYPAMPMFKSLREEWAIKTEGFRKAEEVIMNLPSADRPQGEWIEAELDKGFRVCSVCKNKGYKDKMAWRTDFIKAYLNYCPNCGAKMKGADDEL